MKKLDEKKVIVFWITGLSRFGKTTIAKKIRKTIDGLNRPPLKKLIFCINLENI